MPVQVESYIANPKIDMQSQPNSNMGNAGANMVEWKNNQANALYLDRFGVNVNYLRLFVVDINSPAIELYQKLGFIRAGGRI